MRGQAFAPDRLQPEGSGRVRGRGLHRLRLAVRPQRSGPGIPIASHLEILHPVDTMTPASRPALDLPSPVPGDPALVLITVVPLLVLEPTGRPAAACDQKSGTTPGSSEAG